jgi:multidrug efflux pump
MFFRQFALTIAVSTLISAFNSLTLSPALAALLLQPLGARKDWLGRLLDLFLGGFFRLFNRAFAYCTSAYTRLVGASLTGRAPLSLVLLAAAGGVLGWQLPWLLQLFHLPGDTVFDRSWAASELRMVAGVVLALLLGGLLPRLVRQRRERLASRERERPGSDRAPVARAPGSPGPLVRVSLAGCVVVLLAYGALLVNTWWGFRKLPSGYIPNQDQGRFYVAVQLPDAASLERTQEVTDKIAEIVMEEQGITYVTEIAGQSFTLNANGSNFGNFFSSFAPFEKRRDASQSADAITNRVREQLEHKVPDALTSIFTPPAISGLGSASGFKLIIEDRADLGFPELEKQIQQLIERSKKSDKVERLFCSFRARVPQLYIDLDREQCQALGVNPKDVFDTLQVYLGSLYVNDFNRFGRTWQVIVQARGEFRTDPNKVKLLRVRNADGEMVPLGALLSIKEIGGPINIGRYNMYPAAAILGLTKPGVSTGQGIEEMERLCHEVLSPGMAFEWSEINFMQIDAANNIWNNLIFPFAVAFVFLVLAAQYESWALPLAVILVVPMCILGSLTGVAVTGGDINIFTQIGFVVLVGLASKNAILIVEYAKHKREDTGLPRRAATLEACQLRLRPILMTSFAFILGVVPLIVGHGAGAEMRKVLGVAVFSGMLGVTLFGIFLTPVFFYVIEGFVEEPLFSSARLQQVGKVLYYGLGVLTLGLPWWLPLFVTKREVPLDLEELADNGAAKDSYQQPSSEAIARLEPSHRAPPTINGHPALSRELDCGKTAESDDNLKSRRNDASPKRE